MISESRVHYKSTYVDHKNEAGSYDLHYHRRIYNLKPNEVVQILANEIGLSPTMSLKFEKIDGCDNPDYILSYSVNTSIGDNDVYLNSRCIVAPLCNDQMIACKPADNQTEYLHISVRYMDRSRVTLADFVPIDQSGVTPYVIEACRPGLVDPFNR